MLFAKILSNFVREFKLGAPCNNFFQMGFFKIQFIVEDYLEMVLSIVFSEADVICGSDCWRTIKIS